MYSMFKCTRCSGKMMRNTYPFCPWCGADMRSKIELEQRRKHLLNTVDERLGELREVLSGGRKPNDNK